MSELRLVYNMTLAYRSVIHRHDAGIDHSSIPPSVTVDDATKQNASAASYYKPAFTSFRKYEHLQ